MIIKDNTPIYIIHKKTEKITVAVYLITDFFDDNECLKWKLRAQAVSLMSFVISGNGGGTNAEHDTHSSSAFSRTLEQLCTLLRLSVHASLLSPMNYSIIIEEYKRLENLIKTHHSHADQRTGFSFPEGFFSESSLSSSGRNGELPIKDNKRQYKGHLNRVSTAIPEISTKNLKDTILKRETKKARKENILQLLRSRGEISIKDISSAISNCSEKTLQRELMSLIAEGIVDRIGERRWSTYKIRPLNGEANMHLNSSASSESK
jgi:DNA-binding transcriptional ArsR family regulator